MSKNKSKRNCAFQYAKMNHNGFWQDTKIVCDEEELTIEEAKEFWNEYFPDAAKHIKDGGTAEMALWINMKDPSDYRETLEYISTDADSDGADIWETKKTYFTKNFKL